LDSRFWIAGDEMIERRLGRTGRDWLEGDFSGVVVEANLKVVEHSRATEKIKADAEALRETDRSSNFGGADLERKVMNESWKYSFRRQRRSSAACRFASRCRCAQPRQRSTY